MYRISMLNLRFFPDDTHDKHLCAAVKPTQKPA